MSGQISPAYRSDILPVQPSSILASPIDRLNKDVLRSIFLVNVEDNIREWQADDQVVSSPLTTTRYSSQVCGHWRRLIIQWPFIWGKMIDIQDFQQKTDFWRNEVLRRSGDSPLCITVHDELQRATVGSLRFIFLLLKEHWNRVQKLDIAIHTNSMVSLAEDLWDSMQQPALHLETFTVSFLDRRNFPSSILPSDLRLFSGQASSLREFLLTGLPMSFPAPWLSHLRRFSLSSPITDLTGFLNAMKEMPYLEYLSLSAGLGNISPEGPSPILPHIILPRLQTFEVANDIGTCLTLLECISPPPGSMLSSLMIDSSQFDLTTEIWRKVFPSIANYFQNNFNPHQIRKLFCMASKISLDFRFFIGLDDIDESRYHISIHGPRSGLLQTTILPEFFGVFSVHNFPNTTSLDLMGIFDPTNSQIMRFIASLSSVINLGAPAKMLQRLTKVRGDAPFHFPALRTVKSLSFNDDVKSFLEWRIDIGHPIHELHLYLFDHQWIIKIRKSEEFFEFVEKLPNFKVTLLFCSNLRREYICGKGSTEEYGTGWLLKRIKDDMR